MSPRLSRSFFLALLTLLPAVAGAQVATYGFTGNSLAPTQANASVTSSNFTLGAGVTGPTFPAGNPSPSVSVTSFNVNGTQTGAIATDEYVQIVLTAATGYRLDLTSVTADLQRSGVGPTSVRLYTSLDGTTFTAGSVSAPGNGVFVTATYTLDGTFQDLTTITFRFYGYGATGAAGTLRFDNLTVNGTVRPLGVTVAQTVQDGAGYRLLAAPVQGVTVATLAGINLVQGVTGQYPNASSNLFLNYAGGTYFPAASTTDIVEPGYGFFWQLYDQRINPDDASFGGGTSESYPVPERPLTATGTALNADVTVGFGANPDGFYMLANPFAQALAASGVTQTSGGGVFSNLLQAYDPTTGYVVIDRTTATEIATWQGFFAEVQGSGIPPLGGDPPAVFTYLAASRTAGTPTLISRGAVPTGLALSLDGVTAAGATHDEAALVRFSDAATSGWDADDASKLTPPTAVYALVAPVGMRDGQARRQAVLSRPTGDTADVTLAFTTTTAGTFTLTAASTDLAADATLRDLATGAVVRLSDGYAFTSDATGWTERFVVSFGRSTAGEGTTGAAFALAAPSPNPASGPATVGFDLPKTARVSLAVYDLLGRQVAVLAEGERAAGHHEARLDAGVLAPGVYVVRMQAGTFSGTHRLTVVR